MSNFNSKTMAELLMSGKTAEELAKDFSASLNTAQAEVKRQKAKEEEAKTTLMKKKQQAEIVADFLNTYYPEVVKTKITAEEVIEMLDYSQTIHRTTKKLLEPITSYAFSLDPTTNLKH